MKQLVFHCIANGRKRKNNILSLEDDGRKTIGDELLEHASQYYANLFGPAPFNMFQVDMGVWYDLEQLNDMYNQVLCRDFMKLKS